MQASVVTVASTATLITSGGGTGPTPQSVLILNPSGNETVYVGGNAQVTTSTGFPIAAGGTLGLEVTQEAVYAIVASGTEDVNVLVGGK